MKMSSIPSYMTGGTVRSSGPTSHLCATPGRAVPSSDTRIHDELQKGKWRKERKKRWRTGRAKEVTIRMCICRRKRKKGKNKKKEGPGRWTRRQYKKLKKIWLKGRWKRRRQRKKDCAETKNTKRNNKKNK